MCWVSIVEQQKPGLFWVTRFQGASQEPSLWTSKRGEEWWAAQSLLQTRWAFIWHSWTQCYFWEFLICVTFLFKSLCTSCPARIFVHWWILFYLPATENPSELRPKSTLGGQLNESMFLLRYVKWQSNKGSMGDESEIFFKCLLSGW